MEVLLVLAGGNKELWLPWIATLSRSLVFNSHKDDLLA